MICNSCGAEIKSGAKFCPKCGMPAAENPYTAAPPPAAYSGNTAQTAPVDNQLLDMRKAKIKKAIVLLSGFSFAAALLETILSFCYQLYHSYGYLWIDHAYLDFSLLIGAGFLFVMSFLSNKRLKLIPITSIISMLLSHILMTIIFCVTFNLNNLLELFKYICSLLFFRDGTSLILLTLMAVFFFLFATKRINESIGKTLVIIFTAVLFIYHLFLALNSTILYLGPRRLLFFGAYQGIPLILFYPVSELPLFIAIILCMFYDSVPKAKVAVPYGYAAPQIQPVMFCPKCGLRFPAGKKFCDQCGSELSQMANQPEQYNYGAFASQANVYDAPSGGYAALGFFFPLVGLILYCVWKDQFPLRAKSAGKGALAGVITWVSLTVLIYASYFAFIMWLLR